MTQDNDHRKPDRPGTPRAPAPSDPEAPSISYMGDLPPTTHPNFRPPRYSAAELGLQLSFEEGGERLSCTLRDVSQNGVAFEWPGHRPAVRGELLSALHITCGDHQAYAGSAKVRSVRETSGGMLVGVSFLDSLMNMEDVLLLRDLQGGGTVPSLNIAAEEQAWYTESEAGDRFRALVGEFALFLRAAEDRFAAIERTLPYNVLHGPVEQPGTQALVEQLMRGFVPTYIRYTERIDAALRAVPTDEHEALKAFSRGHLHDLLIRAPFMHRCLTKPLGYPGDYEVMRFLYERHFEGSTLLAKAIHLGTIHTRGARAVRERKELLYQAIVKLVGERAARGEPTRIVSIAAGPAQEVYELLSRTEDLGARVEVMLFDQDRFALEYVSRRFTVALNAKPRTDLELSLRHDTIRRLLDDPAIFDDYGKVDMVFASGLFDYLRFHTGVRLIRNLHRLLSPEGELWVGNMVPENPCRWFLEHHLDWFLQYRSQEDLLTMGKIAIPEPSMRVTVESTRVNPFLVIRGASP